VTDVINESTVHLVDKLQADNYRAHETIQRLDLERIEALRRLKEAEIHMTALLTTLSASKNRWIMWVTRNAKAAWENREQIMKTRRDV